MPKAKRSHANTLAQVRAAMPNGAPSHIVMASSVAPSDTSTSIVIHPDIKQQITCGKTALSNHNNILFSKPEQASRGLFMDILVPKRQEKKPLVVYIPGGGFVIALKESTRDLRTYIAEAGFVVDSIQYRTVRDDATYQQGVADVKAAIRFLRTHADRYDIDPAHVGVGGQSAGGYLAAMVGITSNIKHFDVGDNLQESSAVQAVIDKYGPSDVSKIGADFDSDTQRAKAAPGPNSRYVNGFVPGGGALKDPGSNPISYIDANDPPFLIFHGSEDKLISPSPTLMLHTALRAAGVDSTRYVLEGANHGDLSFMGNDQAGLPWSSKQTVDIIVAFLHKALCV